MKNKAKRLGLWLSWRLLFLSLLIYQIYQVILLSNINHHHPFTPWCSSCWSFCILAQTSFSALTSGYRGFGRLFVGGHWVWLEFINMPSFSSRVYPCYTPIYFGSIQWNLWYLAFVSGRHHRCVWIWDFHPLSSYNIFFDNDFLVWDFVLPIWGRGILSAFFMRAYDRNSQGLPFLIYISLSSVFEWTGLLSCSLLTSWGHSSSTIQSSSL